MKIYKEDYGPYEIIIRSSIMRDGGLYSNYSWEHKEFNSCRNPPYINIRSGLSGNICYKTQEEVIKMAKESLMAFVQEHLFLPECEK
jgi:hypothetical protein